MYTMKSAVTPTSVRASASEWLTKGGSSYGYDDRSRSKYGVSGMNSSSTNSSSFGIAASIESSTKRRISKSVSIMAVKRGGVGSPMRHCQPARTRRRAIMLVSDGSPELMRAWHARCSCSSRAIWVDWLRAVGSLW